METLGWIIGSSVLMSAIALVGGVTIFLSDRTRERLILPLVAFSAGSLLGGAFLHMIPEASERSHGDSAVYLWVLIGFTAFFALEQFLHWHHWHDEDAGGHKSPLSQLMIVGDSLHNFLGGVAVAGAFIVDVSLGITTWIVAAAHEVPQELGKYGVLLHGGWSRGRALLVSVASSLTFLIGGIFAYVASVQVDVSFLVPFAAGNFLYIAASDLVPEVNKHHRMGINLLHFAAFVSGIALLVAIKGMANP
jgi:zinc and cadmium transporter